MKTKKSVSISRILFFGGTTFVQTKFGIFACRIAKHCKSFELDVILSRWNIIVWVSVILNRIVYDSH